MKKRVLLRFGKEKRIKSMSAANKLHVTICYIWFVSHNLVS